MSWRVRPADAGDLAAMRALAARTGGGLTTFPDDPVALRTRLDRHLESMSRLSEPSGAHFFVLVLEHAVERTVAGLGAIYARLGEREPFLSFERVRIDRRSAVGAVTQDALRLSEALTGAAAIGGLFVDPGLRGGRLGRLMARSRFAFVAQHRALFAERILAELRGYWVGPGQSPFWDSLTRHFIPLDLIEADRMNARDGNRFIRELLPDHPFYVAQLPPEVAPLIGRPHPEGEPALKLLLSEGFANSGHVDLFDAGPIVTASVDALRLLREQAEARVVAWAPEGAEHLVWTGSGDGFRLTRASLSPRDQGVALSAEAAEALQIAPGESVRHAPF